MNADSKWSRSIGRHFGRLVVFLVAFALAACVFCTFATAEIEKRLKLGSLIEIASDPFDVEFDDMPIDECFQQLNIRYCLGIQLLERKKYRLPGSQEQLTYEVREVRFWITDRGHFVFLEVTNGGTESLFPQKQIELHRRFFSDLFDLDAVESEAVSFFGNARIVTNMSESDVLRGLAKTTGSQFKRTGVFNMLMLFGYPSNDSAFGSEMMKVLQEEEILE